MDTVIAHTDGRSVHAIADTSHDTADDQMWECVGASLQRSTNDHDNRASEDGLAAAQVVAYPDAEDGTTETTQVV